MVVCSCFLLPLPLVVAISVMKRENLKSISRLQTITNQNSIEMKVSERNLILIYECPNLFKSIRSKLDLTVDSFAGHTAQSPGGNLL